MQHSNDNGSKVILSTSDAINPFSLDLSFSFNSSARSSIKLHICSSVMVCNAMLVEYSFSNLEISFAVDDLFISNSSTFHNAASGVASFNAKSIAFEISLSRLTNFLRNFFVGSSTVDFLLISFNNCLMNFSDFISEINLSITA